jgi:hypothetical protein
MISNFGALRSSPRTGTNMRIRTYQDTSHSRHVDLVGSGNDPWSVDLIVEAVSFVLLGGFGLALFALCTR